MLGFDLEFDGDMNDITFKRRPDHTCVWIPTVRRIDERARWEEQLLAVQWRSPHHRANVNRGNCKITQEFKLRAQDEFGGVSRTPRSVEYRTSFSSTTNVDEVWQSDGTSEVVFVARHWHRWVTLDSAGLDRPATVSWPITYLLPITVDFPVDLVCILQNSGPRYWAQPCWIPGLRSAELSGSIPYLHGRRTGACAHVRIREDTESVDPRSVAISLQRVSDGALHPPSWRRIPKLPADAKRSWWKFWSCASGIGKFRKTSAKTFFRSYEQPIWLYKLILGASETRGSEDSFVSPSR